MPYVNLSTLTYPATNAFPGGIWEDTRNPTPNDFRNFHIGVTWINFMNKSVWFMVDKTVNSGTWVQAAINSSGILDITGNNGGPVGADPSNNINLLGVGTLVVSGSPGTNTLTISQNGTVATLYVEDVGSATPSAGILNIVGGTGVNTVGVGNTVTINSMASVPLQFTEDAGIATPLANNLNIFGGTGISTAGVGDTVTISTTGVVATLYTENSGTAAPSGNNLNVLGASGILTSGAGSTITITPGPSIATTYTENSGTATPAANNLNILGASGIVTAGAGSTVTITPGSTLATLYTEDVGTAAPSGNNLNVKGGTGISTSGAGSTITIATSGIVATEYDEDAGSAIPALGKLKIIGGTGISTSGAGNTVTITNTSSSALTFQEDVGTATPSAGVIMIRGGSGIATSGAGSTVTILRNPLPAFFAYLNTSVTNVTGDGTRYTVLCDTVLFDTSSNYNTGTGFFTAPNTGVYSFAASIGYENLSASHTNGNVSFKNNAGIFIQGAAGDPIAQAGGGGLNKMNWNVSCIVKMTAGDNFSLVGLIFGGTKTVGLEGTSGFPGLYPTFFSGAQIF